MYIRILIFLLLVFQKAEFLNSKYNHNRFSFATFGSLTSNNNILFITEQNLHSRVILNCSNFCRMDRRCIGMEVCRINEELFRCRACCSWMITNKQQFISADNCKYLKKEEGFFRNIAVNKPVIMSSIFNPTETNHREFNAVNNVTICSGGTYTAHSNSDHRPWIRIDLQSEYDVQRVVIFNRQDRFGERLNNLLITVGNTGTENFCGYFGKIASTADQILIYCEDGTVGRNVMVTIFSNPGKLDILNICEFQVFVK